MIETKYREIREREIRHRAPRSVRSVLRMLWVAREAHAMPHACDASCWTLSGGSQWCLRERV
jgi:hypothetical protein